jgi:hypothetical protein
MTPVPLSIPPVMPTKGVFSVPFTVRMPFDRIVLVVAVNVKGEGMRSCDCWPVIQSALA